MNTRQIENILTGDTYVKPTFQGVYAIDKLPRFDTGSCVFNTAPSVRQSGHWIALFVTETTAEYFDSYGGEPSSSLRRKWRDKLWFSNVVPLQSPLSAVCGHYCVYYLLHRTRGFSMASIESDFGVDVDLNDEMVHKFIENRFDLNTKLLDTEGVINQLAAASV